MAESVISKVMFVEKQTIDVSNLGFNGSAKETQLTIPTLRSGYIPYVLNITSNVYNQLHYIYYHGDINSSGKFYIEHNLESRATQVYVSILWVKS